MTVERIEMDILSLREHSPAYKFWTNKLRELAEAKKKAMFSAETEFELLRNAVAYSVFLQALEVLTHARPTERDARNVDEGNRFDEEPL